MNSSGVTSIGSSKGINSLLQKIYIHLDNVMIPVLCDLVCEYLGGPKELYNITSTRANIHENTSNMSCYNKCFGVLNAYPLSQDQIMIIDYNKKRIVTWDGYLTSGYIKYGFVHVSFTDAATKWYQLYKSSNTNPRPLIGVTMNDIVDCLCGKVVRVLQYNGTRILKYSHENIYLQIKKQQCLGAKYGEDIDKFMVNIKPNVNTIGDECYLYFNGEGFYQIPRIIPIVQELEEISRYLNENILTCDPY